LVRRQSKEKKKTVAKKMSQKRSQKSHPRRRRAGKGAVSPTCKATIGKSRVSEMQDLHVVSRMYLECILNVS
jgi:hypothetical protein